MVKTKNPRLNPPKRACVPLRGSYSKRILKKRVNLLREVNSSPMKKKMVLLG